MLQIRVKTKLSFLKKGFSLIEMLIVVSLLGLIALIASGFLIVSLGGVTRAEVNKEVRQNGNYALSVMEGLILNSKNVSCPSSKQISVVDLNKITTNFICDDTNNYKISSSSSESVDLTGENVAVSDCNFVCTSIPGRPTKVSIDFIVSHKGMSDRPSEKARLKFQTEVITKNF